MFEEARKRVVKEIMEIKICQLCKEFGAKNKCYDCGKWICTLCQICPSSKYCVRCDNVICRRET